MKLAADRSGDLLVRVYESLGRRARGELQLNVPVATAATASLLEDPLDDGAIDLADGLLPLALGPFEVRTLRFSLAQ
ncbi:hypothetical protein D1872_342280 [compost metagenome]